APIPIRRLAPVTIAVWPARLRPDPSHWALIAHPFSRAGEFHRVTSCTFKSRAPFRVRPGADCSVRIVLDVDSAEDREGVDREVWRRRAVRLWRHLLGGFVAVAAEDRDAAH